MLIINYQFVRRHWKQILPYIVFVFLLTLFANHYYGRLTPNDSVSYLSIAEKYAAGNFSNAINAYWSPLISWLIALQIKLGIHAIPAFYVIKLFSGLLIIFFTEKIIRLYQWPVWGQLAVSIIVAAWAAYFTLHWLSPDALMAAGLLIYLYLVICGQWLQRPWLTGLLGAGLYFTKAFGFYFFAAHLLLYFFWKLFSDRKSLLIIGKQWLIVFLVFLSVSAVWVSALHHRYGKWIISSAGSYNHGLMQYGNGSVQPALRSGLLPLPDPTAYNSWEEITLVHTYTDWKPWDSKEKFALQLKVIRNNGWYILQNMYGMNRLSWLAIAAGFIVAVSYIYKKLRGKNDHKLLRNTMHTWVFVMLYCFGYAMAGVDERYLFIVSIGLLFILIDLLVLVCRKFKLPIAVCYIAASLIAVSCIAETISKLRFFKNESLSQTEECKNLQQIIPPQSIVATHQTSVINSMDYRGQWHNHGGLEAYQNKDSALKALQQYHINFVLIPDSIKHRYTWLAPLSDDIFSVKNWKVYQLKTSVH